MLSSYSFAQFVADFGGPARVAEAIGASGPAVICNWRRRGVPADRCIEVEAISGGRLSRHKLRPDVFGPAPDQNPPSAASNAAHLGDDPVDGASTAAGRGPMAAGLDALAGSDVQETA